MATVIAELSIIGEEPDRLRKWWDREYPEAFTLEESTK
jgi:hypothetical protein